MSKIDDLINKLCPNGVEYRNLWELTAWDKKFNGVAKEKQSKVIPYKYYLSADFDKVEREDGNIKYISTGITGKDRFTTEELAKDYIAEGEIVCIPWGGTPNVKYHNGKFVTGDNRIATSLNKNILDNKYLYYWLQANIDLIASFYRGSGIKHPSMKNILDMKIAVPPVGVQEEIVHILDDFTELTAELTAKLTAELKARQQQYEYYRDILFEFDDKIPTITFEDACSLSAGGDIDKSNVKSEKSELYNVPVYSNGIEENALYGFTNIAKVKAPCITISARGTIGYCALRETDFYPIVRLICVKPIIDNLDIEYLKYYIQTIKFKTPTSGIPQLTVPMVKNYKIPIPPIEEQKRIAKILNKLEKICTDITDGLPAEIEARQKQYEYYRDKLLTFKELKVSEVQ